VTDSISVTVKTFASVRELLGFAERSQLLPSQATVADLLSELAASSGHPELTTRPLSIAVNRAYVPLDHLLAQGDEVALIPPVSGGTVKLFEVTHSPLSLDDVAGRVSGPDRGGITLFAGTVRGVTGSVTTDRLEYEAYPEMAESTLAQIAAEVQIKWPEISAVSIIHRLGRLEIGDLAVVIAVAAAHREDTFDACHYVIDRVKEITPIWKREFGSDGEFWVEGA
jgi:MoaE-MoaD fusion protein